MATLLAGTHLLGVRVNTQRPCSQAESPFSDLRFSAPLLFAALPLGRSTQHTRHTRLLKRRTLRNM